MKFVDADKAFVKVAFKPSSARVCSLGTQAFAYLSYSDAQRLGFNRAFRLAAGEAEDRVVRVHEGLVDAAGEMVMVRSSQD